MIYSHCIIGGGIVGLATAMEIMRRDKAAKIVLIEKEGGFAQHQTGHNSGVIHAGVYYAPGSLKARLCREGERATKDFCIERDIRFETCGKLIVSTNTIELERMHALIKRSRENGIKVEEVSPAQLKLLEPNISGSGAILVPSTGIVDYREICTAMAQLLRDKNAELLTGGRVVSIHEDGSGVTIGLDNGHNVRAERMIACAGLQSDRIARIGGLKPRHHILPFRGEYYTLPQSRSAIVKRLIYPVPDPALQFLGIHLTRMIDGRITVGPNAVLGFHREGYPKLSFNAKDMLDMAGFGGFWRLARAHWRTGLDEFSNSISRKRYLEMCQKYCPSLTMADMTKPGAGIRAQAVMEDGTLLQDFLFMQTERQLHVCNAPSPAATSSIPIGREIVERLETVLV
ncbi:L-2-hydroxyglutarate oxidase [Brucella thiophenivorans]|uniref:L-2-hydroxyglutarate oxidase n=1 Tax=Brucella thiophenivorans TaxID=571255 RepID=UPI000B98F48A